MKKFLLIVLYSITVFLLGWMAISYLDIVANNLSENGIEELPKHWWNIFVILASC